MKTKNDLTVIPYLTAKERSQLIKPIYTPTAKLMERLTKVTGLSTREVFSLLLQERQVLQSPNPIK